MSPPAVSLFPGSPLVASRQTVQRILRKADTVCEWSPFHGERWALPVFVHFPDEITQLNVFGQGCHPNPERNGNATPPTTVIENAAGG
ncbi:hypothetical protein P7K49_037983 [Saguinus oedipus]|uniref:Uncharacterized protein n=1 Tax=Saguinus oedipus TaxID=9490 RepID=A0ABQ9TEU2_SAGOE|nr:hypothetical protein P7K49_037983 [Saguinus oedipus]